MKIALESLIIEGVVTTSPFLARVMQHPQFRAGDVDTKWLEREFDKLRAELQRPEAHPPSTPAREA